jgi:hypothetical protein
MLFVYHDFQHSHELSTISDGEIAWRRHLMSCRLWGRAIEALITSLPPRMPAGTPRKIGTSSKP